MKSIRITLPVKSSTKMLELARKVLDKHVAEGANSMLSNLDWQHLQPAIEKAKLLHQQAEDYRVQSKMCIEERNKLLTEVTVGIRSSRNILSGVRIKNMQSLGEWGFDVIESSSSKTKLTKPAGITKQLASDTVV